jgi:hypothetical protein
MVMRWHGRKEKKRERLFLLSRRKIALRMHGRLYSYALVNAT